jgi:nucleoside-diphosphate-sugar epimerase
METLSNRGIVLVVVAGGVGFIGCALRRFLVSRIGDRVVDSGKLTRARSLESAPVWPNGLNTSTRFRRGGLRLIGASA